MSLETILTYGKCHPLLTYIKLPCSAFPSLYVISSQESNPNEMHYPFDSHHKVS